MEANEFLQINPVFTAEKIGQFLRRDGPRTPAAIDSAIRRLRNQGRIGKIRKELYYSVPDGETSQGCEVDLVLAASLMTEDAVIAYTSTLAYHIDDDLPLGDRIFFFTKYRTRPVSFRGVRFTPCVHPAELRYSGWTDTGVRKVDWNGLQRIRIADPERSLVDVLSRLKFLGGWRAVWPLLDKLPPLDLNRLTDYLKLLNNPTAVSRVGWYLDRSANRSYEAIHDYAVFENIPDQPRYLIPGERGGVLVPEWNIIVPNALNSNRQCRVVTE